jgi:anti-sigma B factor antagonist
MNEYLEVEDVARQGELTVETATNDNTMTVSLVGELDIRSAPNLEQRLASAQASEVRTVVVDMSGLQFIDSTGLRVLLRAKQRADGDGRELRIDNAQSQVRRLFELAGILEVLSLERG